jgi:tetratricopeptide (TPR) repeat protein
MGERITLNFYSLREVWFSCSICCQMAEYATNQRDYDKAIKCYKEALTYVDNDSKVMLKLADLHLTIEDLDACQHQCSTLLKNDEENDAATVVSVLFKSFSLFSLIKCFSCAPYIIRPRLQSTSNYTFNTCLGSSSPKTFRPNILFLNFRLIF